MMGLAELRQLETMVAAQTPRQRPRRPLVEYQGDPVRYAQEKLGIATLTAEQEQALRLLHVPPYRVLCLSGHDVGKTFLAAVAVNYWYDCFDPSVVITTAPTQRDVVDLLWTEIRLQRGAAGLSSDFIGDRAPEMRTAEDHYAKGYTACQGESFQGRHRWRMLFIFDEGVGVDGIYYETLKTMFDPELGHACLVIGNPTDTTSAVYTLDQAARRNGSWHRMRLSALDHPNIQAQREGKPKPVPSAISLSTVNDWVTDWCDPIPAGEATSEDLEWPPGSGQWHRPGPIFQCRAQGYWPSAGTYGVWSARLWEAVTRDKAPVVPPNTGPQIGCDVARYGDDWTVMIARVGPVAVHVEGHNGWDEVRTAARLKELARELAVRYSWLPQQIAIKVDDDGCGGGVVSILRAPVPGETPWQVVPINASTCPSRPGEYPRKRDELWFQTAEKARRGLIQLGRLPQADLTKLEQQLMAPTWKPDPAGRRVVEKKEVTKEKLRGVSPDWADALNLAYYDYDAASSHMGIFEVPPQPRHERRGHGFGRGR
jgi:hypothetical protein